jgi:hypothetical protein
VQRPAVPALRLAYYSAITTSFRTIILILDSAKTYGSANSCNNRSAEGRQEQSAKAPASEMIIIAEPRPGFTQDV